MAGIHINPSQKGSLHRLLNVPQADKIPAADLAAKSGDSPDVKKKKQFASNARHFNHPALNKLMGH